MITKKEFVDKLKEECFIDEFCYKNSGNKLYEIYKKLISFKIPEKQSFKMICEIWKIVANDYGG